MNLFTLNIKINPPDDYDLQHAEVVVESPAVDPDELEREGWTGSDGEFFRARVWAAGILARLAVIAYPHIDAEARDHGCRFPIKGEPLEPLPDLQTAMHWTYGPSYAVCGACDIITVSLVHSVDWGAGVDLLFSIPTGREQAWVAAIQGWLALIADMDRPPEGAA